MPAGRIKGKALIISVQITESNTRIDFNSELMLIKGVNAHVAQLVEHFLGKEEVHRFNAGRGLQCHLRALAFNNTLIG